MYMPLEYRLHNMQQIIFLGVKGGRRVMLTNFTAIS
jgi:hypothetical protein